VPSGGPGGQPVLADLVTIGGPRSSGPRKMFEMNRLARAPPVRVYASTGSQATTRRMSASGGSDALRVIAVVVRDVDLSLMARCWMGAVIRSPSRSAIEGQFRFARTPFKRR